MPSPSVDMFQDIKDFHEKFGINPTQEGHEIPDSVLEFRVNFLFEELLEYACSMGLQFEFNSDTDSAKFVMIPKSCRLEPSYEKALDGLVDLAYVVLGTALVQNFDFNEAWRRVHAANMAKVRASGDDDPRSTRKNAVDIVKPEGWLPPDLSDLIKETK